MRIAEEYIYLLTGDYLAVSLLIWDGDESYIHDGVLRLNLIVLFRNGKCFLNYVLTHHYQIKWCGIMGLYYFFMN